MATALPPAKWLDAINDKKLSLRTIPSCMTLCDLHNDNYHKLVVAEIPTDIKANAVLRIYKGTGLVGEQGIPGIPSAIESFYADESDRKIPMLAISIGPSVLFYRNLKPYFKFTLPSMSIEPLEKEMWRKLPVERVENFEKLIQNLKSIDISDLTVLSQKLLSLPVAEREAFIRSHADIELQRLSIITAMTTLLRLSSDAKPPSCLVLATENGEILILDTHSFFVLYQAKICSFDATPSFVSASGQFDVDFKIIVATREGSLCLLRKTWLEGRQILKLDYTICGLAIVPIDQTIVIVGTDNNLACYSKKGKKLWAVPLGAPALCMVPVPLPHLGITLVCVALQGGAVQLYSQKIKVDEFQTTDTVSSMIFGPMGQEEHVLALVTESGSLLVKILKRTAEFNVNSGENLANQVENADLLQIPKKSSIFVEQTLREKEHAKGIYNSFQVELWRLRLTAARATVEVISSAESTISGDLRHAPIKLAAEVCGMGPQFHLFLTIENMSTRKEATNLSVLLHADHRHYLLTKPMAKLPVLVPGVPIRVDFEVVAVLDPINGLPPADLTADNSIVRVMIIKFGQAKPLIAAVVAMPESEAPLES